MRRLHEVGILVVLAIVTPVLPAQDARQVVERAIKQRCPNESAITRQRAEVISMQGKIYMPTEQEATGEIQVEWPASFRWDRTITDPLTKEKKKLIFSVRGDKGWMQLPLAPVADIPLADMDDYRTEMYGRWLSTLYPLLDKNFTLVLIKDNRVGDEAVSVVKASLAFRPDVYLSFSKKSGHLLKVAYRAHEAGVEMRKEHLFSDYKDFDGLQLPSRWVDMRQAGMGVSAKGAEWTVAYKFVDKIPPTTFEKPDPKK